MNKCRFLIFWAWHAMWFWYKKFWTINNNLCCSPEITRPEKNPTPCGFCDIHKHSKSGNKALYTYIPNIMGSIIGLFYWWWDVFLFTSRLFGSRFAQIIRIRVNWTDLLKCFYNFDYLYMIYDTEYLCEPKYCCHKKTFLLSVIP